ncbi:hypothetical protein ACFL5Y_00545 [Candidatus Omnitrophota bacterium]
MPIHLDELDILSQVKGLNSVLITSCNMCAGASLAMKENKPFIQFFKSLLVSPPLERYVKRLQIQLNEIGVKTKWFKGGIIQQFFLCLSASRQRNNLHKYGKEYDAVIVLGCDSAIKTVRDSVKGTDCKVIKGMGVGGIMNTKPKFRLPCNISFENAEIVPMCDMHCKKIEQSSS